ncbi:uncharacterized protein BJ171DRAFT_579943 [Polychytrium aggregatum]|uniref:uncharacterized protein n=1 Tax=Polychytrium aggregatum TaxID=110093 RepID=UPI0022FDC979|nr:uncharacterized protein BJ171DRAFT_579943 [Polychytrium aggregatum]KAI9206447.1 hypothetical protein BJ171DRAFT_579943 [Polychytrium aggregatum]
MDPPGSSALAYQGVPSLAASSLQGYGSSPSQDLIPVSLAGSASPASSTQISESVAPHPPHQRQKRTNFTRAQLEALNGLYIKCHRPHKDDLVELGRVMDIDITTVRTWFRNKRQTHKRQMLAAMSASVQMDVALAAAAGPLASAGLPDAPTSSQDRDSPARMSSRAASAVSSVDGSPVVVAIDAPVSAASVAAVHGSTAHPANLVGSAGQTPAFVAARVGLPEPHVPSMYVQHIPEAPQHIDQAALRVDQGALYAFNAHQYAPEFSYPASELTGSTLSSSTHPLPAFPARLSPLATIVVSQPPAVSEQLYAQAQAQAQAQNPSPSPLSAAGLSPLDAYSHQPLAPPGPYPPRALSRPDPSIPSLPSMVYSFSTPHLSTQFPSSPSASSLSPSSPVSYLRRGRSASVQIDCPQLVSSLAGEKMAADPNLKRRGRPQGLRTRTALRLDTTAPALLRATRMGNPPTSTPSVSSFDEIAESFSSNVNLISPRYSPYSPYSPSTIWSPGSSGHVVSSSHSPNTSLPDHPSGLASVRVSPLPQGYGQKYPLSLSTSCSSSSVSLGVGLSSPQVARSQSGTAALSPWPPQTPLDLMNAPTPTISSAPIGPAAQLTPTMLLPPMALATPTMPPPDPMPQPVGLQNPIYSTTLDPSAAAGMYSYPVQAHPGYSSIPQAAPPPSAPLMAAASVSIASTPTPVANQPDGVFYDVDGYINLLMQAHSQNQLRL